MTHSIHDALAADLARWHRLVDEATLNLIPDSGDRTYHVRDIAAELVQAAPQAFAVATMAMSAGDRVAALAAVADGLDVLAELRPNALHPCDGSKGLARIIYRKFVPGDVESADEWARRDDIPTTRRQSRIMADKLGLILADHVEAGRELLAREAEIAAAAAEHRKNHEAATRARREAEALSAPFHNQHRTRRLV